MKNNSRYCQFMARDTREVTKGLSLTGGLKSTEVSIGTVDLRGTIFDPAFQGKDVVVNLAKSSSDGKGFYAFKGGRKITQILIPWHMRQGLKKLIGTDVIQMPPLLTITNDLISAIERKDRHLIPGILKRWSAAYAEYVRRKLDQGAIRIRKSKSGAAVAAVDVREDAFSAGRYYDGIVSSLSVGEIGFSDAILDKLNNNADVAKRLAYKEELIELLFNMEPDSPEYMATKAKIAGLNVIIEDGKYFIAGRWPSTDAVSARVRRMEEKRKRESFVVYVPVEVFSLFGDPDMAVLFMKLVEGDNDGDGLFFNFIEGEEAYAQVIDRFIRTYGNVEYKQKNANVLTYKDHIDSPADERMMLQDKIEQKTWIGALSIMMYCGFAYMESQLAKGEEIPCSFTQWMEATTQALEKCFDKKHLNGFKPHYLYGLMQRKKGYTWSKLGSKLVAQGLDGDVFAGITEDLGDSSLRDKAQANVPFQIGYLLRDAQPGEREKVIFDTIASLPEDTTLASWVSDSLIPSIASIAGKVEN